MIESAIESACVHHAAKHGILSYKLRSGITGVPDRLFLLPWGRVWLVEFKAKGGALSARQKWVHAELDRAGHPVSLIWSTEEFKEGLTHVLSMV